MGGPCNILYSHVFVVHSLCCAEKVFVRLFSVSALLFINSYSFKSALFTFRTFSSFRRSFKLHTSCECCLDKATHLRIRRGIVVGYFLSNLTLFALGGGFTYLRISVQIHEGAWKKMTFLNYELWKGWYSFYPVKSSPDYWICSSRLSPSLVGSCF